MSSSNAVIEGEIVDLTHRRRNRNVVRDVAILPPTVGDKAVALGTLDVDTQVRAVAVMLTHAATELAKATDAQSIVEWKAKAGAIQELTKQLQLSKGLQLDAAEFVRRTERALGVAIRVGQQEGTVETTADAKRRAGRKRQGSAPSYEDGAGKTPVNTLLTHTEQTGGKHREHSVFALTDGVTDVQFAEALAEARTEGNLSRANVARKARAKAALVDSAPVEPEPVPSPEPKRRLTKHDSAEMLANISGMLNGIVETLPFVDPSDIDFSASKAVVQSIRTSMIRIRALLKEIENV